MGIKIGIPVVDGHSITLECLQHLSRNSTIPESVEIVVIDNESTIPYYNYISSNPRHWEFKFDWRLVRLDENQGYYFPLLSVAEGATSADIIGVMHNDLFIYEKGWDRILLDSFLRSPRLGMVGVCGSNEVDDRGGRGGGTMCNFAGQVGQLQEHTGRRITDLQLALILDSMFIAVRQPVIKALGINESIAPCHFYDKIWPLMTIAAGWQVGVLGLYVDHQGGLTTTGAVFERFCERWCDHQRIKYEPGKASFEVYLEAERRFLAYGRSIGKIPSRI
jgi:hypothetical protein